VPVEFRTGSPGDVRFAGLTSLTIGDPALEAMRAGLRDLISSTFETVLSGADEDAVYALWRALTRDRVAEAKARFEAPVVERPTTVDVAAAATASREGSRRYGPHDAVDPATVTDIVVAYDPNITWPAAVLFESLVANASGPLRLWVLGRGLTEAYQDWVGAAFPSVPITFLPCDRITYGGDGVRPWRIPARITISTMDRLLLPIMLADVDRVVYLDVDTLMLDDVCRLARTDLGGRPIAARDSNVSEPSEWTRAGRKVEATEATELRRRMGLRHGYGHPALNAGVLVMDLARMRQDDFSSASLGLVERFGLHDQDTMLAYVGPDRAVLEPRWNAMPVLEDVADPSVIHWASFGKPWEARLTFEQERWQMYARRVRDRAGDPPTTRG
jgi:lipopolysaccharide biosynthesis glycosyltransferase